MSSAQLVVPLTRSFIAAFELPLDLPIIGLTYHRTYISLDLRIVGLAYPIVGLTLLFVRFVGLTYRWTYVSLDLHIGLVQAWVVQYPFR